MKNILFLLFPALLIVFVHSQILAIDYGTMYVKAALVHTGAGKSFSIVENPKSNRKFINSVSPYLFRWESINRNASTKQIRSLKDQEVHLIASFTHDSWSICTKTQANSKESRKSSYWTISRNLRAINSWASSSWKASQKAHNHWVYSKQSQWCWNTSSSKRKSKQKVIWRMLFWQFLLIGTSNKENSW